MVDKIAVMRGMGKELVTPKIQRRMIKPDRVGKRGIRAKTKALAAMAEKIISAKLNFLLKGATAKSWVKMPIIPIKANKMAKVWGFCLRTLRKNGWKAKVKTVKVKPLRKVKT